MSQEALDFGFLYRVDDGARAVYDALRGAVADRGILNAAGACGIDRGDLRRSLDRDGRRVAVEHAMAIAAICGEHRRAIAGAIVAPLGLELAEPRPLTDKERADRLEAYVRAQPLGEQQVAIALGGKR